MNHNIMEMELESSKCIIHCGRGGRTREKKSPKKETTLGPTQLNHPLVMSQNQLHLGYKAKF